MSAGHLTAHSASSLSRSPQLALARSRVQYAQPAQFANGPEWLRQRKAVLRAGFGYRCAGGEKLVTIADALGEDDGTASRLLDPNDRTKGLTENHLKHLDRAGFKHVADAVRRVRIEDVAAAVRMPLAAVGRVAA